MTTPIRRRLILSLSALALLFGLVMVAGFVARASAVWSAGELNIVATVNGFHFEFFDVIARAINVGMGPTGAAVVTAGVVACVAIVRRSTTAVLRTVALIGVPWALADVVKIIVQRPRLDSGMLPFPMGVDPTTFSYPSGHTAFAAALAMAAVLVTARHRRIVVGIAGVMFVVVVAWSRLYLGAHYPLDVVASMVLVPPVSVAVYDLCKTIPRLAVGSRTAELGPR